MIPRLLLCALAGAPALFSADKTTDMMLDLLRDVGGLQEQIKGLQKSLDDRFAAANQSAAEQARAAADQTGKAMAALSDRLQKGLLDLQDQQTKTVDTVAGVNSQMQGVTGDLSTMRQALSDLTTAVARLSTQLSDLSTAVKALGAPKADAPASAPVPEISATDLMNNAENDRLGGKLDLAMKEYTDYVSKFGDTAQASDAQYRIGEIHYSNEEWDDAVKAFDLLLQNYPDSRRAADAMYYKGLCLGKLGRWPEAMETLKDLRKRFPTSPMAKLSLNVKPPAK
jgi:TolA-binding protein